MAFEPKTEAGKAALAAGADPAVVAEQEVAGELSDENTKSPEHVETPAKDEPAAPADKKDEEGAGEPGAAGKDGEKVEDDEDDDAGKQPNRAATSMPVWKHKELMKQETDRIRAEAETQLQRAIADATTKQGGATSEDVGKIAEEFNLSPEVAGALIDKMSSIVKDRLGIDSLVKDVEERKAKDQQSAEERGFQEEWDSKKTQAALEAAANGRPITAEVKAKVKELAYDTTYAQYRLADVVRLNPDALFPAEKTEKRSAESGRGGASRGAAAPKDLGEVSPEDIDNMSAEEFARFSKELEGGGSRFTRTTTAKGKS